MYPDSDPIAEWFDSSWTGEELLLDEDSGIDSPLPARFVIDSILPEEMNKATGEKSLLDWAEYAIGDTHKRKRKSANNDADDDMLIGALHGLEKLSGSQPSKGKGKAPADDEPDIGSDDETATPVDIEQCLSSSSATKTDTPSDDETEIGRYTMCLRSQPQSSRGSQQGVISSRRGSQRQTHNKRNGASSDGDGRQASQSQDDAGSCCSSHSSSYFGLPTEHSGYGSMSYGGDQGGYSSMSYGGD